MGRFLTDSRAQFGPPRGQLTEEGGARVKLSKRMRGRGATRGKGRHSEEAAWLHVYWERPAP